MFDSCVVCPLKDHGNQLLRECDLDIGSVVVFLHYNVLYLFICLFLVLLLNNEVCYIMLSRVIWTCSIADHVT